MRYEIMREIKYRQWIDGSQGQNINKPYWHYWGYIKEGVFITPIAGYKSYQYTGLKDKNGVEIYEGDIIKVEPFKNMLHTVEWFVNGWHLFDERQPVDDFRLGNNAMWEREVVGNIYENPELLNK